MGSAQELFRTKKRSLKYPATKLFLKHLSPIMTPLPTESTSRGKRKAEINTPQSDQFMQILHRHAKMQRRNSKVGRMFFDDIKQARDELQKETDYFVCDTHDEQSSLLLDNIFAFKSDHSVPKLNYCESIPHDSAFGFRTVPIFFQGHQEAAIDSTIIQKTRSLSIEAELLDIKS